MQSKNTHGDGEQELLCSWRRTPSKVVTPPINKRDNADELDNVGIIGVHDGLEDDDIVRGARGYTSQRRRAV